MMMFNELRDDVCDILQLVGMVRLDHFEVTASFALSTDKQ